jgi:hypothetical protein
MGDWLRSLTMSRHFDMRIGVIRKSETVKLKKFQKKKLENLKMAK